MGGTWGGFGKVDRVWTGRVTAVGNQTVKTHNLIPSSNQKMSYAVQFREGEGWGKVKEYSCSCEMEVAYDLLCTAVHRDKTLLPGTLEFLQAQVATWEEVVTPLSTDTLYCILETVLALCNTSTEVQKAYVEAISAHVRILDMASEEWKKIARGEDEEE